MRSAGRRVYAISDEFMTAEEWAANFATAN